MLRRVLDYQPRIRKERERKPIKPAGPGLAGSRKEMARRYLSGELVQALSKVERYWRPGYHDLPQPTPGNSSSVKLFGPGRTPAEEQPDFYTLRYKNRGTIIGAEGGMFVLKSQQLVLRDDAYLIALAHLRARGLCCTNCAERTEGFDPFSTTEEHRLQPGERCFLNEALRSPMHIWVTNAEAVIRSKHVPEEFALLALELFDRAVAYEIDEHGPIKTRSRVGRPKKALVLTDES